IALALYTAFHSQETRTVHRITLTVGPEPPATHGIIITRIGSTVLRVLAPEGAHEPAVAYLFILVKLMMIGFGVSLAGALWWVSRRLYDNEGGYVALALCCSSVPILLNSTRVNVDIIAAWGLYGMIYTAIGVAHTLYAPPKKWRPRILLLGTAFGVTAGAHFAAFAIGLVLCAAFMLHLAPGRRVASLLILATASAIALAMLWAFYGFSIVDLASALRAAEAWKISPGIALSFSAMPQTW